MQKKELIKLLADGQFHSGSELGESLGVSRTAIWKNLSSLESLGLKVESHKGKGYCVPGGIDLLDRDDVIARLPKNISHQITLDVEEELPSTNAFLLEAAQQSVPYHFCVAERQTEGRGRRGRSWYSPYAKNIYVSVKFELEVGPDSLGGLSLVAGLACVKALEDIGLQDARLKWPNDIWLDGKKLAGILVELQGEANGLWHIVVGVGINVHMAGEQELIDQPWISLSQKINTKRNNVLVALIERLVSNMDQFRRDGFAPFVDVWSCYDCLVNKEVYLSDSSRAGIARGITGDGALLVDFGGEIREINSGEVSVRPYAT